ncbi:putative membrane protein [Propionispora sp. 2/2-37]|uniref:BofC C-terminal domain-containing protein n=1 Tax=Propionispora sp. 2/2-37 TaxID=1677858 RepID=UPI0006BB775D|nr:BofC C-terminal domain-containing protein [Propionispora sp. 2/2-37]CUH94099.1 putative membrane protein [Propionispora sp. 2/2-37]
MLSFLKLSKNKKIVIMIGGIFAASIFAYFIYSYSDYFERHNLPEGTEVAKRDDKIKVTPETMLLQKIQYTKCNEEEVLSTKVPDTLVGLHFSEVQKIYPGWVIDKFDTAEISMTLKVDSFCREHANNMFIGIKDGYVAVYYGKPGPKAIAKEVTKIPVNHLMEQDLEELRRGVVVHSKEELLRTIEGLQSR